jgi:hypothetical protein
MIAGMVAARTLLVLRRLVAESVLHMLLPADSGCRGLPLAGCHMGRLVGSDRREWRLLAEVDCAKPGLGRQWQELLVARIHTVVHRLVAARGGKGAVAVRIQPAV